VTVRPGLLEVDYEVSLTELTLTQDLRRLIGSLAGADRAEWLARYGQVTGPLNAKGILASVDGAPVTWAVRGFDLAVEEHPRYTFHFESPVARQGQLALRDTNYVSSEGTSRLAVRGRYGVIVSGDSLPSEVEQIEIRSTLFLSDEAERRTKQVEVQFRSTLGSAGGLASEVAHAGGGSESGAGRDRELPAGDERGSTARSSRARSPTVESKRAGLRRLSQLLDETTTISWTLLLLFAMGLGAAHAIQPGHGKTLVTAVALGPGARLYQPALLGLATTVTHTGSVLLIAAALWYTGATEVGAVHVGLTRIAGFVIAAAGFWRVGRYVAGLDEHDRGDLPQGAMSTRGLIGLGLAGGLVPCWDAVGLLVLTAALGRLAAGVGLVLAFSAGMAAVLVAVGCLAWKIKSAALATRGGARWQRALGLAAAIMLSAIGLYLFLQY
jgi:ABC-type nickel/cobalt efflux system permease component RcnA